jgi:capsular polysaccharide biosynthesis protein
MLLDIVEVAHSHSRLNLAAAFANILDEFRISDKVSCNCSQTHSTQVLSITCDNASNNDTMIIELQA